MLLILMYHRAVDCHYGNPAATLRSHFAHLSGRVPVCLPGEPLRPRHLNLCLTFDDAYADFYANVFPLLKEFSLKAVLAVPTAFILERTNLDLAQRIAVSGHDALQSEIQRQKAPFCTWSELKEMAASGLVELASHSHNHVDFSRADVDVAAEARTSKALLQEHLGRPVSTFVFPFGRVNAPAFCQVRQHYRYSLRIGGALNREWLPKRQPLCRVEADRVGELQQLLRWHRLTTYALKMVVNHLRAALGKWDRMEPQRTQEMQ